MLLTNESHVIEAAKDFHLWIIAIPICGFAAFLWDGVMVGATMAKGMVVAMLCATILFFTLYNILIIPLGNNGLWIAFLSYLATRGIIQTFYFKKKVKHLFL